MKRRTLWIALALMWPLALVVWLGQVSLLPAAADNTKKIDAVLQTALLTLPPEETVRFIVHLEAQASLNEGALPTEKVARRQAVVDELQAVAAASQARLLPFLDQLKTNHQVVSYQPLWIINAVVVEGNAAAVNALSTRPDITRITLDVQQQYLHEPTQIITGTPPAGYTWGLEMIMAPHTWYGLGVKGEGVVIAIMDTGVDWQHPALMTNYRGNQGGAVNHNGHWFDAVDGSTEPIDPHSHGTHVAGTAVGQGGIGVAPGATWIGVRMLNAYGQGNASDIHLAFQWLLAPAGNPALAPDIVNASWSSPDPTDATYLPDIYALQSAGIIPLFAAGNRGPDAGSIGSPASLPGVWAIGASDWRDELAWFSSRGPSPMTSEIKPHMIAPGGGVISSLPGADYGMYSGTSMATPHMAGAAALLLSANPGLSRIQVQTILRQTAQPIDPPHPNQESGYGRLDAYAAIATQVSHGVLTGRLIRLVAGAPPLAYTAITITTPSGESLVYPTDSQGVFSAALKPGSYSIRVAAFGYEPITVSGLVVNAGQTTQRNIAPVALPFRTVAGVVLNGQGEPIQATVAVPGTPVAAATNAAGQYSLVLPYGTYEVIAAANGYRLGKAAITLSQPGTLNLPFNLAAAPRILLINDGLWHYEDHSDRYQQGLYGANYAFTAWPIYDPYHDVPSVATMSGYDIVIWASPRYSPNYIGAGNTIETYLNQGGKLLVFGRNVAQYDGGTVLAHRWWDLLLRGRYTGRQLAAFDLTGVPGTDFEGLAFGLNETGSAMNQNATDQVMPRENSLTEPIFTYSNGKIAGLEAGLCDPYQIVYWGFGLEGVGQVATQADLIERSMISLQTPVQTQGLAVYPGGVEELAFGGRTLQYTVTVRNTSETLTDTFTLALTGQTWNTQLLTPTLTLGPCGTGQTVVSLTIPNGLPSNTEHNMTLEILSTNSSSNQRHIPFQHKTPGHILFVDDDRFYDAEGSLVAALEANGIAFDRWNVGWNAVQMGSPTLAELAYYDMVFWYTGYDWYAPITPAELTALKGYLAQGGRLFLSSQDYLYYHLNDPFTSDYLGVATYYEEAAPTLLMADEPLRQSGLTRPLSLNVAPYQNFGDGMIPGTGEPVMWQDTGLPGALTNQGLTSTGSQWRTMFWSFPVEKLGASEQVAAINGIMGYLSDLGDSTFAVDETYSPAGGANRVFTITLRNNGDINHLVTVANTIPQQLQINVSTITGGASYNQTTRQLHWQGIIPAGGVHEIRYVAAASPSLPPGSRLDNQLTIRYFRHNFTWQKNVTVWVGVPDLRSSHISAAPAILTRDNPMTYTLTLHNETDLPASTVSATLFFPLPLHPITDTLMSSSGQVTMTHRAVHWQGAIPPGETVTVSLVLTATNGLETMWLGAAAIIDDGFTDPFLITNLTPLFAPHRFLMPYLTRSDS